MIRECISDSMRFKTDEEKLVLLGEKFASDPLRFKFSFKEKTALREAVTMLKHLRRVLKQYTFSRTTVKQKSLVHQDTSM